MSVFDLNKKGLRADFRSLFKICLSSLAFPGWKHSQLENSKVRKKNKALSKGVETSDWNHHKNGFSENLLVKA